MASEPGPPTGDDPSVVIAVGIAAAVLVLAIALFVTIAWLLGWGVPAFW